MSVRIKVTLDEALKMRGNMKQKELIELIKQKTGENVRAASVSELKNNQRTSLNTRLLALIAQALEIQDIRELLTIEWD
ncbi:MAG TPA: helix-turn-helix domain-containing protein [Bacillus sp. (in: firmicutes)]|uniref:helix-turn-helix domain-containing protein n=1 Tax=Bacillus litorisediminis TaxID=2922713 RepID=UPI001FAD957C|nr:helix-turn-helix domain-containing protein [Bacillus litorisediminis]HWO74929.1 helix-turn-helix domain-containing protein [Bacillus sp. (in: firmicutes)]